MGACVSAPRACVGGRLRSSKKKKKTTQVAAATTRKRRRVIRRKVSSHRLSGGSLDRIDPSRPHDRSFNNPTFQGSIEEAWFDSVAIFDSDCDEEDYMSVPDDVLSLSGIEGASRSSTASLRDTIHGESFVQHTTANDQIQRTGDIDSGAHASHSEDVYANPRLNGVKKTVFVDEVSSSTDEIVEKDEGLLDNCGIIPGNCLPCLASTVPSVEKRRSLFSSPPNAKKKITSKLSFKWREGHPNATFHKLFCSLLGA